MILIHWQKDEEVDDFPKGKTSTKKRSGAEELPKNTKLAGKTIESNHRRTVKRKRDGHASEYKSVVSIPGGTPPSFPLTAQYIGYHHFFGCRRGTRKHFSGWPT